ncbi:MAG: alpha amylase C-terminal domain-containing protein [Chroococcidiopsidaceae cyanobacterium CP_BM_RX_35]|nr:alpha amylase C-terminal domain-containing protein [Chroococcidiopsidaceae cyanobacterium CP_BM_RX_35]
MPTIPIQFTYLTGLRTDIFRNARLTGSWDQNGHYSNQWTSIPMQQTSGEDACLCFTATVELDDSQVGWLFRWGVILDGPAGNNLWGLPTEINDRDSNERYRSFHLQTQSGTQPQDERYYLTHCRRLGAQKYYRPGTQQPGIRFTVWAPNAENVEVVFGQQHNGYIAENGSGIDTSRPPLPLFRQQDGIWQTDLAISSTLADFSKFDHSSYMYRITKANGQVAYRTDLYSRCQNGKGRTNPRGAHYSGPYTDLDGSVSCSVVIDQEQVARNFQEDIWPEHEFIPAAEFWNSEFTLGRPIPNRVEDLIIYELHVGALGYGNNGPGTFADALQLLDSYLINLGVNAVELLPISEFRDDENWGYETSHYFALEYSAGGRDQLKHFVRECHRRGIAVILDVVYNHYDPDAERAEWFYDADTPEQNIYYWYEGSPANYPQPDGGYLDNLSTGFAPRFYEEMVRKMFISSAAALMEDFHIDGFRVDQTTSIHQYNVLHANGAPVPNANIFGIKFLREWTRTLKLIRPSVMLIAEDHSDWYQVTESPDTGGLGFDAVWYANFYHHLVGDTRRGQDYARLIPTAGYGQDQPLAINYFAGALGWSGHKKVVYHECHDEAGNSYYEDGGNRIYSRRTIVAAVNSAPLIGETRRFAEARCHFAFGMAILSPGTPMFLMGEEIGAQKPYRYQDFFQNKEDLIGERHNNGQRLFRFYQDLIRFRLSHSGLRSHDIDIIYIHDADRVIAFRRWDATEELLIVASLNNHPFASGYTIESSQLGDGNWREIFNSDSDLYGGDNVGNSGASIPSWHGRIHFVIPANGFIVCQKSL